MIRKFITKAQDRADGKELGIEHIRRLQLPNDSIINPFESGRHGTGGEVE